MKASLASLQSSLLKSGSTSAAGSRGVILVRVTPRDHVLLLDRTPPNETFNPPKVERPREARHTSVTRTTMSIPLPPEIFDLIVEHLCEEQATLKVCSVVSKSWVPCARRHLFARVEFHRINSRFESWMKAFPDPSNSPAYHTRHLSICHKSGLVAAATVAHTWIRAFCNIVNLTVEIKAWWDGNASLVPLHALSSTLKSLRFAHYSVPHSEVFSLICSFPSPEDLELVGFGPEETDMPALPSTSPKFTGTLSLSRMDGARFDIKPLLALPGGLHFTTIKIRCAADDLESITSLVSVCCGTLETICIMQNLRGAPSLTRTVEYLTMISGSRSIADINSARSLQGHESQESGVPGRKAKCSVDIHSAPDCQVQESSGYYRLSGMPALRCIRCRGGVPRRMARPRSLVSPILDFAFDTPGLGR